VDIDAGGTDTAGAGGGAAQPRQLSVYVYVNANTKAIAAAVRPDPYALSDLVDRLPAAAAALLGWVPGLAVHEVGFAFDPLRGGATVFARAGLAAEPDGRGARLLLGTAAGAARPFVLGVEIDATIDLGAVPLFGEALRGVGISDLSVAYATEAVPEDGIVRPPSGPLHPGGYGRGPALSLTVSDGSSREQLRLAPAPGPRAAGPAGARAAGDPPPRRCSGSRCRRRSGR
jgi:hypothetical protein